MVRHIPVPTSRGPGDEVTGADPMIYRVEGTMNAPSAHLALVFNVVLVGCSQVVSSPVAAFDAGHVDGGSPTDAPIASDVPDEALDTDAATPEDAPAAAADAGVPEDVPFIDTSAVVDVVAASDARSADVPSPPLMARTHPLLATADVTRLFDLHQITASSMFSLLFWSREMGDDLCPRPVVRSGGRYTGDHAGACSARRGAFMVDFDGAWHHTWSDPCADTDGPGTYDLMADRVTLRGTNGGESVDLAIDGTVHLIGVRERARSLIEWVQYSWEGTARWTSGSSTLLFGTGAILTGRTVRGVGVSRSVTADGQRYEGWIGTTTPDGGAELGVEWETVEPIRAPTSTCSEPTAGRLVLHGAVDAEIRFAPGDSCAPPTWTRAGVPMGTIRLPTWGHVFSAGTCGSGS